MEGGGLSGLCSAPEGTSGPSSSRSAVESQGTHLVPGKPWASAAHTPPAALPARPSRSVPRLGFGTDTQPCICCVKTNHSVGPDSQLMGSPAGVPSSSAWLLLPCATTL
jgi:hypothetical protein